MRLGRSDLEVSSVGTGTWQWGGAFYWGYGRSYTDADLTAAYAASIENGINWFDTAEIYGRGRSELILGRHVNGSIPGDQTTSSSTKPLIATKFFPYPWRFHRSSFRRALKASLKRLNTESIDIYQIHFPFRPRSFEYWVDALADAAQDGLVKAVGVSNFSAEQTKCAHELLDRKGIVLATNQVGYSLLNRKIESNGILETCRDLNVSVISYGPLAEGLLTGKYRPDNPPPFMRKWRWARKRLKMLPPLISLMSDIASAHDASPSQVALNWLMRRGTLPIPGAKSAMQAKDNAVSMTWSLSNGEFEALNAATERYLPNH
jgi:aryl-alcohol dehydrogenase-like predicted oxidoreductase